MRLRQTFSRHKSKNHLVEGKKHLDGSRIFLDGEFVQINLDKNKAIFDEIDLFLSRNNVVPSENQMIWPFVDANFASIRLDGGFGKMIFYSDEHFLGGIPQFQNNFIDFCGNFFGKDFCKNVICLVEKRCVAMYTAMK